MSENDASELLGYVEAGAAVVAVVAGFAYVGFQRWREAVGASIAAGILARHSVNFVSERLDALVDPDEPIDLALRGSRALEMVEVFRELEMSRLPSKFVEPIAVIRSATFAVNSRIDEVLKNDKKRKSERRSRLYSAGRTLSEARSELEVLRGRYAFWDQSKFVAKNPTDRLEKFLKEAADAKGKELTTPSPPNPSQASPRARVKQS